MSMRNYIPDDEETAMTPQQIERDFDRATTRTRTIAWIGIGVVLIVSLLYYGTTYAQQARTATITFTAPTTRTDGTNIAGTLSYEVWQGLKGGTKALAGTINNTSATITTGLQGGREYCWHVIAVEAGNPIKSAPSNESCKAFDLSGPNVVTITVN